MSTKITILLLLSLSFFDSNAQTYIFPDEAELHEGTWLAWPHQYEYGNAFRNENDATWVAMTNALQANEKVHIITYNTTERTRITTLLTNASVPLTNVNFVIKQTNDVWMRDTAGIFVRNTSGQLVLQDWGFNGWGGDYAFDKDNTVPITMGTASGFTPLNLNSTMIVEGGSWELDGNGTFLATKSSILCQTNPTTPTGIKALRNVEITEAQANAIFTQYIGAQKFIWLDGWYSQDDITDAHIDGFAKFAPGNKLVTMNQADLLYWGLPQSDIDKLYAASNINNVVYTKVYIPLTANNVRKTNGQDLGYKGSYANYYVANNRVLVPNYNDPNDAVANAIIASIYPERTVVGIDCRNLYANGGMVHCVTQQQPQATLSTSEFINNIDFKLYPNPAKNLINIQFEANEYQNIKIEIYDFIGKKIASKNEHLVNTKNSTIKIDLDNIQNGIYICKIFADNKLKTTEKIIVKK